MKLQNINYHYDLVRDHVPLSGATYWATLFMAVACWANGVIQLFNLYKEGVGYLLLGVIILIVLLLTGFIWLAAVGMKPLGKVGDTVFVEIKNGTLISKLTRFASPKKTMLAKLEKIDVDEKRIILKERGKDELYIRLKQIQNAEKRAEFVEVINDLKQKKKI